MSDRADEQCAHRHDRGARAMKEPHLRHSAHAVDMVRAFLGVGSHVVLDWFMHHGRPGVRWLGYNGSEDRASIVGEYRVW